MSNVGMIIEERAANIGNFLVGRLLPFRQKKMVGPFIFIDHMGPAVMDDTQQLDVPPHPHIGLSTLTYLFEGAIMHRDSMGYVEEIQPGAVNWMTAGKGCVHSERTPDRLRNTNKTLHGLQIWIALPKAYEFVDPSFTHVEAEALPKWEDEGVTYTLIAGTFNSRTTPVPVYSPLYLLELKASSKASVSIGEQLFGESALYILQGTVTADGEVYGPKQILVANDATLCTFEMSADAIVYIFGGEPFPEDRHIFWNFVATEKATIDAAREDWIAQRFPKVPGEQEFVPLPDYLHKK